MEVTMETDWGAKGAQLSGAQVQAFIKDQLKALKTATESNSQDIPSLSSRIDILNNQFYPATLTLKRDQEFCKAYREGVDGTCRHYVLNREWLADFSGNIFENSLVESMEHFNLVAAPQKLQVSIPGYDDSCPNCPAWLTLTSTSGQYNYKYIGMGQYIETVLGTNKPNDEYPNVPYFLITVNIYCQDRWYFDIRITFLPLQPKSERDNIMNTYINGGYTIQLTDSDLAGSMPDSHEFITTHKAGIPFWIEYKNLASTTPYVRVFIHPDENSWPFSCLGKGNDGKLYYCSGLLSLMHVISAPIPGVPETSHYELRIKNGESTLIG